MSRRVRLLIAVLGAGAAAAALYWPLRSSDPHAWAKSLGFSRIRYATSDARPLHLFVRGPTKGAKKPAVLLVHGGGWNGGSPEELARHALFLEEAGFVVVLPEYRLFYLDKTRPAAAIEDVDAAYRYVIDHAEELGVDPARVAVLGASAGGHLAYFVAKRHPVRAAVLLCAVVDTSTAGYGNALVGEDWRTISPLHQVEDGLPPILEFHARDDDVVPFRGAEAFAAKVRAHGGDIELVSEGLGGHGFYVWRGEKMPAFLPRVRDFLLRHTLGGEAPVDDEGSKR